MLRIRLLEGVVAVRAGKVALRSLVRADGHREVGKRVALPPYLELLVPPERGPFHADRSRMEALLKPFEDQKGAFR